MKRSSNQKCSQWIQSLSTRDFESPTQKFPALCIFFYLSSHIYVYHRKFHTFLSFFISLISIFKHAYISKLIISNFYTLDDLVAFILHYFQGYNARKVRCRHLLYCSVYSLDSIFDIFSFVIIYCTFIKYFANFEKLLSFPDSWFQQHLFNKM